jgi:DNA replication protein DnaC
LNDVEQYYNYWKKAQDIGYGFIIPVVFNKNYLNIKRSDIKDTESDSVMNQLKNITRNIPIVDETYTNIYLYSNNCGNGKTMWASLIAHSYVRKTGKRAYFVKDEDLHRLASQLNSFNNEEIIYTLDKLCEVPLLVIDDIGTLDLNRNSSMLYHKLIDARLVNKLPTIYTSNLNEKGLQSQLTIKLASRIWSSSIKIEFNSLDIRQIVNNNPFK